MDIWKHLSRRKIINIGVLYPQKSNPLTINLILNEQVRD